jgi:hypothetical protein
MLKSLPPETMQAEAYCGDTYLLIRNSKTENAIKLTKSKVATPICEVPDFPAFLERTAAIIKSAHVVVALGDSRTANFSNWPRLLATDNLRNTNSVVVNLADWARCSEDHFRLLEFYLKWLNECSVLSKSVVFVGGLTDMHHKVSDYFNFMYKSQAVFLTDAEEQLKAHKYGRELTRLTEEAPAEWDVANRWVARRILAVVTLLNRLCTDANSRFFAILEPTSYADHSPGYQLALRRAYEADAEATAPFEAWARERGYVLDPSAFHERDTRPILENLRDLWQAQDSRSGHGSYVDWSDLFRTIDECCFDEHFDAVHYNALGGRVIADAIFRLLSLQAGQ